MRSLRLFSFCLFLFLFFDIPYIWRSHSPKMRMRPIPTVTTTGISVGGFLPEMRGRRAISRRTHTVQPVKRGRSSHAQRGGGKDDGIHRNGKGHILDHAFRE